MAHALDHHLALIGFMGAGKTTLGSHVADLIGRPFVDLDREIEKSTRRSIPDLFRQEGEKSFRMLEAEETRRTLKRERPAVIALGGGAIETPAIREALREYALTLRTPRTVGAAAGAAVRRLEAGRWELRVGFEGPAGAYVRRTLSLPLS